MNRTLTIFYFVILTALFTSSVSAQSVSGTINEDGFIVISGSLDLIGIDVQSPGGHLIPVTGDADPFQVLVTNTTKEILFGSVGIEKAVPLDGDLVLSARYEGGDVFDLIGTWGGPVNEGPISFTPASFPIVPEPSAGILASFGLWSILALRRRR